MARRARASITALLFAATAGACASSYVAVGLDGGSPADASVTATATTSTVAPPNDGGPPPPALDAGKDGGPVSPCEVGQIHLLCADFDTTSFEPFDDKVVTMPGTIDVTSMFAVSAPRALFSKLPRRGNSDSDAVARAQKIVVGWKRTRLAFDVRMETGDFALSDTGVSVAGIFMTSSGGFTGTLLFTDGVSTAVSIESQSTRYVQTKGHLGAKKWIHVVMDFDPTRGKYDLVVDGMPESLAFPVPQLTGLNPTTELSVGITSFEGPTPDLTVLYDNVVVDTF